MRKPRRSGTGASARPTHLLDTSTLLWALGAPERLSPRARRRVDAGENIISVASYWEVVIKAQKGLLTIADLASWWRRATEPGGARVANPGESSDRVGRAPNAPQGSVRTES
jgi:hypothetical protein